MKSCFVISPIGAPGSDIREHADDVFDFIIKPAVERAGYAVKRADHDMRPGAISEQMYDAILRDDLLIGLLTFNNPNVFYEIAIAQAAARPLILLLHAGHDMPFDVHDNRAFRYDLKPKKLLSGEYADLLYRTVLEIEAAPRPLKVPFWPGLSPLGASNWRSEIVPRAEALPRDGLIATVREAKSFFWAQGIALFAFPKIDGFEEATREALAREVEFRALLMSPDNPALEHILRDFSSDYAEIVRREIKAGAAFWESLSPKGSICVRFQSKGVMFSNTVLTDTRCIMTQYSLARSTSESPTIITDASSPLFMASVKDYEWAWKRAENS